MNEKRQGRRIARLLAALVLAVLPWAATGSQAAVYVIDQDGHILSVGVGQDPGDPFLQGIQFQDRDPGGAVTTQILPSTLDSNLDISPSIALRSGGVVVAWARNEGDGYDSELALTVRESSGLWRSHVLLTSDTLNDEQPRVLVDPQGLAQILWWGNGIGGPIYMQGFDPDTGLAVGPRHRPLDPPVQVSGRLRNPSTFDGAGGLDDPGVPTTGSRASAISCDANPAAAPDHGLVMSCGRPAAYQLSECVLTVGVQLENGAWTQTTTDLSSVNLSLTGVRELTQSLADAYCPQ